MVRSRVVLPPPLGPTRATTSPSRPSRETPSRRGVRAGPVATPLNSHATRAAGEDRVWDAAVSTTRLAARLPTSTTCPASIASTRPPSRASWSRRCSAMITAVPSPASAPRIVTTERPPSSSSCESGSSSTSTRGCIASTPASARRCRSPPESVLTARPRRCAMPVFSSASATRPGMAAAGTARFSSPNATSRSTVGYTDCNSGSWKTKPTLVASTRVAVLMTSWPHTAALPPMVPPWKCGTNPLNTRSSDDFPEPEAPVTRVTPSPMCRSAMSSASVRPPGYR